MKWVRGESCPRPGALVALRDLGCTATAARSALTPPTEFGERLIEEHW